MSQSFSDVLFRIDRQFFGSYEPPPATIVTDIDATAALQTQPPSSITAQGVLPLARGSLAESTTYARAQGAGWLIDMADDICDPVAKSGTLYAYDGPNPESYLDIPFDRTQQAWSVVQRTDPLRATIYEYRLASGQVIGLTKISKRAGHSKTSTESSPDTMRNHVLARDNYTCWISGISFSEVPSMLINSHIVPKRMGDAMTRVIHQQFEGAPSAGLGVHNAICGITLMASLDKLFDVYELGLRRINETQYEAHVFPASMAAIVSRYSFPVSPLYPVPLHGTTVTEPRSHNGDPQPPPGLFRWHYLQCFIKHFGTAEYKTLDHIAHVELPLRMEGDSDYGEDGDPGFTWPSAAFDRGRAETERRETERNKAASVREWIAANP